MCHMKTLAFLILNQYTEEIRISKDHCKEHCNVVCIFFIFQWQAVKNEEYIGDY